MWQELLQQISQHNIKALARSISLVENEQPGYEEMLQSLPASSTKITGITGPPGAGKSTLVDAMIGFWVSFTDCTNALQSHQAFLRISIEFPAARLFFAL